MSPRTRVGRRRMLVVALVGALAVAGLVVWWLMIRNAPPDAPYADLGPVRAAMWSDPAVPRTGENRMMVKLADPKGQAVRGAEVEVIVFMAQMGSMPYMESRMHGRETTPGRYEGSYSPLMAGRWEVDLRVKLADGRRTQGAYRLTVGRPGITFSGGSSPPGSGAAGPDSSGGAPSGTVNLGPGRRQEIGVTTARLERRDLTYERRTTGTVVYDERRQVEVAVKVAGWIRDLHADFEGVPVRRGQVLFTLYSPELFAAQQEYASALDGVDAAAAGASRDRSLDLARAARQRLLLWDVPVGTVDRIARTRRALETVPVLSPASGVVTEKHVVEGSQVTPGMPVLRIASTSPIWVQAQVYPHEIQALAVGQRVRIRVPDGGTMADGRIAFIDPEVEPVNRTARARIELANPRGLLKPGMFVDVELIVPIGPRLAVPVSAVLRTGTRDVVFIDAGGGRLEPHEVRLGRKAGDFYELLSGLDEGDLMVTSGTFLVGAESRLRSTVGSTGGGRP